jgi:hypothetical protein
MEWLLLLLCPLMMMIFMMKGMRSHSHDNDHSIQRKN